VADFALHVAGFRGVGVERRFAQVGVKGFVQRRFKFVQRAGQFAELLLAERKGSCGTAFKKLRIRFIWNCSFIRLGVMLGYV